MAAAAYELGISVTTARQHLSGLYRRTGCLNAAQAAYRLGLAEATAPGSERRGRGTARHFMTMGTGTLGV